MQTTQLGRTGLQVTRTAFGCLPIQRISSDEAGRMLRRAVSAGINFFDTARAYTDSEEKIGRALSDQRSRIIIATKTGAQDRETFFAHLATSLSMLQTDYIDIYQFHNPSFVPRPGGADGLYDAAQTAKEKGLIRHIGITQHSRERAEEAVLSGLYDTLQYPFNHLSSEAELSLYRLCEEKNVGFICMKALSGGLVTDASIPFAFLRGFAQAVPIWGFQRMEELEQLIALDKNPPAMDSAMEARIRDDQKALTGAFCRGCGYCLPCPAEIPIHFANRMKQFITRSPSAPMMSEEWRQKMENIERCTRCGLCERRCPYGLKPYETLPAQLLFYREYVRAHTEK